MLGIEILVYYPIPFLGAVGRRAPTVDVLGASIGAVSKWSAGGYPVWTEPASRSMLHYYLVLSCAWAGYFNQSLLAIWAFTEVM